ncbi:MULTISPECIES: hypothetical protein [Pseudomonas]|uniref:Uncharacterized protein n=2 Tax=Pseudomonas TaxID=286 RepID=A0A7G8A9Q6_PSEAI|nr:MULTISPECIES: hypothetical protein [Pseudomonas]MCP8472961.1 hypothetical protein [Pseudomonas triclosanedens]MCP8479531.1 hypothetical protein [Pseudomonas triclosanedens]ALZ46241.1 Hypothetical protein [Pseudomonas putida]QNI15727.1 Hypothetical protein [Pseudomonas aeruginosa]QNI16677.1 Hypothetical protein [Pseudomonas aeruginosa]
MADERSNEALHPTKEVRITGERSATLVGMAIQASRVDTTILQMKMAGSPETRRRANEAADRFERALNAFDAEMREVNKDLNLNRNGGGQSARSAQQPGRSKQAPKPVLQKAKKGGEQQAQAQGTAKATQTGQQKQTSSAKPQGQQPQNAGQKTNSKPQQPAGAASKPQKPTAPAVKDATPAPKAAAEAQA